MKRVSKKIYIVSAALFFCFFLFGKEVKIDVLKNKLAQAPESEKAAICNEIAALLRNADPDASINYAQTAIKLANQWRQLSEEAKALENIGMVLKARKDMQNAITLFDQARHLHREVQDKKGLALNLFKTALIYEERLYYSSSIDSFKESMAIQAKLGDKKEMVRVLLKLGNVSNLRSRHLEALDFFLRAKDIFLRLEDAESINLRFDRTGKIYQKPEQYLLDLEQHLQSGDFLKPIDTGLGLIYTFNKIGKTYTELEEFERAEIYLSKARQLIENSNQSEKAAVREHYLFFSHLYAEMGEFQLAYDYQRSYIDLKDAVFTVDTSTMIKDMGRKYDNTQRALEGGKLRKKFFQLLLYFSLGFILLFFIGILLYLRYRQRLKEQEMKRRITFFMNLAHEIKTPLTLIRSYFARFAAKQKPSDTLDLIQFNLDTLIQYIRNFFTLEKLERDQIIYDHDQTVNLSSICERMAALTEPACEEKGISLSYTGPGAGTFVRMDPDAFNTVLYNLLQNAVKYTDQGGRIEIGLKETEKRVKLTIKDTGIGIDEKDLESIFKPFARLLANKRRVEGLGLGLSIVKNIIDQIRGRIELKSKPGEGTLCTVLFEKNTPLPDEREVDNVELSQIAVQKSVQYKAVQHKKNRPTILLVEDEPDLLICLQELFLEARFNAYIAENGKAALEQLKKIPKPDVIVADIMMDVMNGYVLFDYIRQNDMLNTIPFVFLSALSADSEILKGLGLGAVEYIPKPFNNEKLVARVKAIIGYTRKKEQSIRKESTKIAQDIKGLPISEEACLKFDITERQKDILRLKQQGLKYTKIAETLGISDGAVKAQVHLIKKKTEINDINVLIQLFFYNTDESEISIAPTDTGVDNKHNDQSSAYN